MSSAISMHEADDSKAVLWDNPEGWGEEGGGRQFQDRGTYVCQWLTHVDVWQRPPKYCKVTILQLKERYFLKKKVKFKSKILISR